MRITVTTEQRALQSSVLNTKC